ncbi:hypothetical protein LCGC14_3122270 [marine sediment metagenome]|uniref:Uncharacterized protein n=1 Tax=marine sediment metagenome TaxID=412755 RepID=A0A0F8WQU0_9ZZZZ
MKLELTGLPAEVVVFVLGLFLGAVLAVTLSIHKFHDDLCQEQFTHAETAADTLNIIQNDKFCLEYSK